MSGRVMLSYAQESPKHVELVGDLADFLRSQGFDARIDQYDTGERQDWAQWMVDQLKLADRVLVICSRAYRHRFEHEVPVDEGRGVQIEGGLISNEIVRDRAAALRRFLPVLLGDATVEDIPLLLLPYTGTHYAVRDISDDGCASLLDVLRGRPGRVPAPVGDPPAGLGWPRLVVVLRVSGGSALERDHVARGFVAAAGHDEEMEVGVGPDGSVSGAVLGVQPDDPGDVVGRGIRAVCERVQVAGRTLVARVGAHLASGPGDETPARLADCAAARALHRVRDGRTVVGVSSEFHDLVRRNTITYPVASAFRQEPDGWFAVAGRSVCPEVPAPSTVDDPPAGEPSPVNRVTVADGGIAFTAGRDQTLHFGDVITGSRDLR